MQIKKSYIGVSPDLLFDEVRDFVVKHGAVVGESRLETYSLPSDSSSFISRGTLTFKTGTGKECLRAHIVGAARGETKLMLDINEQLFPQENITTLENDLDFIFRSYEQGKEDND